MRRDLLRTLRSICQLCSCMSGCVCALYIHLYLNPRCRHRWVIDLIGVRFKLNYSHIGRKRLCTGTGTIQHKVYKTIAHQMTLCAVFVWPFSFHPPPKNAVFMLHFSWGMMEMLKSFVCKVVTTPKYVQYRYESNSVSQRANKIINNLFLLIGIDQNQKWCLYKTISWKRGNSEFSEQCVSNCYLYIGLGIQHHNHKFQFALLMENLRLLYNSLIWHNEMFARENIIQFDLLFDLVNGYFQICFSLLF
jgi:hypothetical protein